MPCLSRRSVLEYPCVFDFRSAAESVLKREYLTLLLLRENFYLKRKRFITHKCLKKITFQWFFSSWFAICYNFMTFLNHLVALSREDLTWNAQLRVTWGQTQTSFHNFTVSVENILVPRQIAENQGFVPPSPQKGFDNGFIENKTSWIGPCKMVSVSGRCLFYQQMDEKIKTWKFIFPSKENPYMEKALFDWPTCRSMTSKRSIDWFLGISRAWSFFTGAFAEPTKSHARLYPFDKPVKCCISVRLLFLFCSRVFIPRSYENRCNVR